MSVTRNYAIRFRPSGGDAENDTRFVGGAIRLRLCGTTGPHRRYVRRTPAASVSQRETPKATRLRSHAMRTDDPPWQALGSLRTLASWMAFFWKFNGHDRILTT
ncbi:hypothetical protein C5Y97_07270 [Blastopirellula marina]|uniref:Uncharacterized protein n=1 Tax=Blastopirellula marina TaxID=124 RepID=A0A2S8G6N5_9BACT|nr:hypothetical protein C5Y98_07270 [Blastopirellula marina]PTL45474.1 hypothetical protein C5Y97_07270 [Blastopirellula marina]